MNNRAQALSYVCPPIVKNFYRSFVALHDYCRYFHILHRNRILKNKYRGEDVYVIANGPSVSNFDLMRIVGAKVITMNYFNQHELKDRLDIVAHCVGDPVANFDFDLVDKMIREVNSQTYWFNVDVSTSTEIKQQSNYYFYLQGIEANAILLHGNDLALPALRYQSTSQMAINIALYMGFNRIYLIGFDHDWLATRGVSPHFYSESDRAQASDLSRYSYTEMIEISRNLFAVYHKIAFLSRRAGVEIVNLTNPTFLDVFKKG